MDIQKDTKWLCENSWRLERFSGQWVVFSASEGVVGKGSSLNKALKSAKKKKKKDPFVFHVPSKDELDSPVSF